MIWSIAAVAVTPVQFYEMLEKHRMVPDSPHMLPRVTDMARAAKFFEITENGNSVAHIVVSNIVPNEVADLDLVPNPVYFKRGQYEGHLDRCLSPVLSAFFESGIRRLNSAVPESRSRTKHALLAVGFKKEGMMRRAVHFRGRHPEDVVIMGMIESDVKQSAEQRELVEVCDGAV